MARRLRAGIRTDQPVLFVSWTTLSVQLNRRCSWRATSLELKTSCVRYCPVFRICLQYPHTDATEKQSLQCELSDCCAVTIHYGVRTSRLDFVLGLIQQRIGIDDLSAATKLVLVGRWRSSTGIRSGSRDWKVCSSTAYTPVLYGKNGKGVKKLV